MKKRSGKCVHESEGKCGDNVQRKLIAFRNEFLNCFFLPDLSEGAYQIHKGNVCKGQINEIRERFKQAANQMRAQNVTLESLSFNDLSGHAFIRECEEPRKRLEANLREQASGVLSQACNEPGQNQEESNQMAQGNQPGLFSIPTPNIRANSNSGSSRSSSGSSQNQLRLPGNVGALPASEVPYDPGKYAGSDSSKRDGGGSSPTPPLPEGDSNFSEDQLTVTDAAGGGNRQEK